MLINADQWIYTALSGDATLTSLLSSGAGVVLIYPNDFETLPVVTYSVSQSESDMDFWDNQPNANDVTAVIDVYVQNDALTRAIESAVDSVMSGLSFTLEYREPLGDETSKTQHVTMRYSRMGVLAEDVA